MEVRCGNCSKLFHVANDRITGKGVKFACTRCGEYVRITREDLENSLLSQTAVSALDEFRPKPVPVEPAAAETAAPSVPAASEALAEPAYMGEPSPDLHPSGDDFAGTGEHDFLREGPPELPVEPHKDLEAEPVPASPLPADEPLSGQQASPAAEPSAAQGQVQKEASGFTQPQEPEVLKSAKTAATTPREPQSVPVKPAGAEPAAMPKAAPSPGPKPSAQPKTAPAAPPRPSAQPRPEPARPAVVAAQATPKKEPVRARISSEGSAVIGASAPAPASSNKIMIAVVLVILGLLGGGMYWYMQRSTPTAPATGANIISTEGLLVNNASGSLEANGDLLISGVIENTTDAPKKDWYIVVDILDATGAVMKKVRLLNGRQIFTHEDYEIMAKRGMNVQEMKEAALKDYTVVLQPRGKMSFEVRYLQPPVGIASFNATLQSADRDRLIKEIAKEAK